MLPPIIFRELIEFGFEFEPQSLKYYASGQAGPIYTLRSKKSKLLAKVFNQADAEKRMLAENLGLETLRSTQLVHVPEIFLAKKLPSAAILIMEFIAGESFNRKASMEAFGIQMAKLHQLECSAHFGFDENNYLGALLQTNTQKRTWSDFYFNCRLKPQIDLAINRGLLPSDTITDNKKWIKNIDNIFPPERPSLIHGDLWAGNMIANEASQPYLIDPAISYSHREMDIAMSKLFGGFTDLFYNTYHEIHPLSPDFKDRIELSQLYFLLVHLNLFGKSYASKTRTLMRQYFG